MPEPARPGVVDGANLVRLRDDVGPAAAAGMVDRFLAMLPQRLDRLRLAVAAGEAAELRDAALSLGCSATMLGAHRLAAVCDQCRTATGERATEVLAELGSVAAATASALAAIAELRPGRVSLSAGR